MSPLFRRLAAVVVVAAALLPAQDRGVLDGAAIERAVADLVATPDLAGGRVGVEIRDAATGAVLAAHDADKGFLTASNMKLISAAVALKTLGADFQWTTRVVVPQAREDLVDGDLWLVGGGDPSLGGRPGDDAMAPMRDFAEQLWRAGVRRVRGYVRGDGSVQTMGRYGAGWQWDYLADDYAAPCAGLNWAENVITLVVEPGKAVGELANVRCEPAERPPGFACWGVVRTVASGVATDLSCVHPEFQPAGIEVRGVIAVDAKPERIAAAVSVPSRFAATALVAAMQARGIAFEQAGHGCLVWEPDDDTPPPAAAPTLAEVRSPKLAEVLVPTLKRSINLYAEQLWRSAAQRGSSAKTSADCERHAKRVLQQLGVDTAGMVLADGSGLSRRNLVQPRQLTALLLAIRTDPQLAAILPALPIAGVDGTIGKRLVGNATRGHVRAKTGFVSYVACLSGYLDRPGFAPPLVFSVMLNNYTCTTDQAKAAIDTFVEQVAVASGWTR